MKSKKENTSHKSALLAAGARIINNSDDVDVLTAATVTKAAELTRKDFSEHFGNRAEYLRALLLQMFDETRAEVLAAGTTAPKSGHGRVWKCMEAYLDGNLKRRGMRALVSATAGDPVGSEMVRRRFHGYGMVFKLEFEAMLLPNAAALGRLFAVMTQEAAAAEHEAGGAQPDIRASLYSLLRSL